MPRLSCGASGPSVGTPARVVRSASAAPAGPCGTSAREESPDLVPAVIQPPRHVGDHRLGVEVRVDDLAVDGDGPHVLGREALEAVDALMAPVAITDLHLAAPRLSSAFLQGFLQAKPAHDSILESTHSVGRSPRQGLPGEARNGVLDPDGGNH